MLHFISLSTKMQFLLLFVFLFSLSHSAILKTSMINNYPQIAVLGCVSNKANLYYDIQRQVWVEHLVSPCVEDEESILKFCQQAYPSLNIRNIIRLDTVLSFEKWCELMPSNDGDIPRCKIESSTEETVQPFRCLHIYSQREELAVPTIDCTMNSISRPSDCLRAEKWQELATVDCSNRTMVLNSSIMPLESCGLATFRGIKYLCCVFKDVVEKNDYETILDDNNLAEDDPIQELLVVPQTSTMETHRKIIAMSLGSREPNWMEDYRRWNTNSGYFADDEDTNDDQEEIKLSSTRKSHLTINEHERFTKEKEEFQRKYYEQIDQLKSRWQKRQNDIQPLANENPDAAQKEYAKIEQEFRQDYDVIKQTATQERTRINELHENNLDSILDIAKKETYQKLNTAWNENPIKTENIKEALYNYLHVLLRDRIHLVNRYERLRVVDPDQSKRKRVLIHERLRSIANQINEALNNLRRYSKLQSKIQPHIDGLLSEYDEVNQAADKLLIDYIASLSRTTTIKNRLLPLGRDENKIYPFSTTSSDQIDANNNNEYDYDKNDEDDDDDEYDDSDDDESTTTTTEINNKNNDPIYVGDSDWDVDRDTTFNVNNNEQIIDVIRPLMPINNLINQRRIPRYFFITYLPYIIGSLFVLCIIFGILILRFIIQQRRKSQYGNQYEKNYVFTEIDSCTPEEKALHALQINGYENPTYKFFESQTPKC
jgi:hypothetical protein